MFPCRGSLRFRSMPNVAKDVKNLFRLAICLPCPVVQLYALLTDARGACRTTVRSFPVTMGAALIDHSIQSIPGMPSIQCRSLDRRSVLCLDSFHLDSICLDSLYSLYSKQTSEIDIVVHASVVQTLCNGEFVICNHISKIA